MKPDDIDLDSAITLTEEGINRFEDEILENSEVPVENKIIAILVCSAARAWTGYTDLDNRGRENA